MLSEQGLKLQRKEHVHSFEAYDIHGNVLCPLPTVWCARWWLGRISKYSRGYPSQEGLAERGEGGGERGEKERERKGGGEEKRERKKEREGAKRWSIVIPALCLQLTWLEYDSVR